MLFRAYVSSMTALAAFRTESNTPDSINERIRATTEASIAQALRGGPGAIEARLRQLDREWDTERVLETLASSFVLTGITLGATVDRRWLALPGVVAAFLLQHGLQGWCPPLPAIRAMGVRTMGEIEEERHALKAARGDYARLGDNGARAPRTLLEAASRRS
jgi:hypothetical protein